MTPSDKLRVLVTRPAIQAEALCAALVDAGAVPVLLPLIAITAHRNESHNQYWNALTTYDWIIFTSANGVNCCWNQLSETQQHALQQHPKIAAVGPATAESLRELGITVTRVAPEHVAESLVETLGDVQGQKILWPRSAQARAVVTERLHARGAQVDDVTIYDVSAAELPSNAARLVSDTHMFTFSSPSAVQHFVRHFGTAHKQPVICIGPVTAAAARTEGLTVSAIAESYTIEGMVDALTLFANSQLVSSPA